MNDETKTVVEGQLVHVESKCRAEGYLDIELMTQGPFQSLSLPFEGMILNSEPRVHYLGMGHWGIYVYVLTPHGPLWLDEKLIVELRNEVPREPR